MANSVSFTNLELAMLNRVMSLQTDSLDADFGLLGDIFEKINKKYMENESVCESALEEYFKNNPEIY